MTTTPEPGTVPTVPDRPFTLRTVNGSRIKFVIRVDGRAVGHLWRTNRDDRRSPWAYRIRMTHGHLIHDLAGEAEGRTAAEAEVAAIIANVLKLARPV